MDAVVFDSATGGWRLEKSFSTRDNPAHGVNDAFNRLKIDGSTVSSFVHGTTLGINTVLERRGVVTGIITNSGFEDVFERAAELHWTQDAASNEPSLFSDDGENIS